MNKLLSIVAVSAALVSVGAFAMSHGGAMKDGKLDCTKQDKMDDKMKAECKKMEEAKKAEEKKAEPKK
ncbi:MAG: hypothetical protein JNL87_17495 [Burkholderiaceae bacterium]|nr:hypothetical protein [Burkholderiaceae bacterium]